MLRQKSSGVVKVNKGHPDKRGMEPSEVSRVGSAHEPSPGTKLQSLLDSAPPASWLPSHRTYIRSSDQQPDLTLNLLALQSKRGLQHPHKFAGHTQPGR